jgi:hypothetical protein
MGGPRANILFAPLVSTADLHYRFLIATGRGLDLGEEASQQWTNIALDGALLSLSQLADETTARGEQVGFLYNFLGLVVNPGVNLKFRNGRLVEGDRAGGALRRRMARAAMEEDEERAPCDWCRPPTSSIGGGFDWNLKDPNDPAKAPLLSYDAWLAFSWRQPSGIQAQVSLGSWAWSLSFRQKMGDNWSLLASLKSPDVEKPLFPPTPLPEIGSLGISYQISDEMSLRLERRTNLQNESSTWTISLQAHTPSPIPAQLFPHLGATDPEKGLQLPAVAPREPLTISGTEGPH